MSTPNNSLEVARPNSGAVSMKQGISGQELTHQDTAAVAAAAYAKAEVEARMSYAMMRPRFYDTVRDRIMEDARRPATARIALYNKPIGKEKDEHGKWKSKFATNFSIRFIEQALRHMQNTHTSVRISVDEPERLRALVTVLDLETNSGYSDEVIVAKTVERRDASRRQEDLIGQRENSYGESVYILRATEDEVNVKLAAAKSKKIRDLGQRLIPREILEEAREIIDQTVANADAKDPAAEKKKILDGFSALGVKPEMVMAYVEKPLDTLEPGELKELRRIWQGILHSEFTWQDVVRVKEALPEETSEQEIERHKTLKAKLGLAKDGPQT